MDTFKLFLLVVGTTLTPSVLAEVKAVSDQGFVSEHVLQLAASPEEAFKALVDDVALWWDASHSYGGEASAFSLSASAGGCFCEELPGAVSVEHMRVVNVTQGKRLVMLGGLGPLQTMAVTGSMSFDFAPHEQGTLLTYRYSVGGYVPGGLQQIAGPVDQVQLGQLQRLQQFVETGQPLN